MIPRAVTKILVLLLAYQSVVAILEEQYLTHSSAQKVFPSEISCKSLENKLKSSFSCLLSFKTKKYIFYEIETKTYGNLYIALTRSKSFYTNKFHEFYDLYNGFHRINEKENQSCILEGYILDENSKVILNICGGLQGLISKSDVDLFISPSKNGAEGEHILYLSEDSLRNNDQQLKENSRKEDNINKTFKCGFSERLQHRKVFHRYKLYSNEVLGALAIPNRRVRRAFSQKHYIETMIVADQTMFEFYGENEKELRNYLLSVMAIVSSILKDSSIGNFIHVSLVRLVILTKNPPELDITSEAQESLRKFCKWQKRLNKWSDNDPEYFDTAILITRTNLCTNTKCDTLGLAELGSMCDSLRSCSIVEDNGLSAAFTIAHELGHLLNSPHDGINDLCTEELDKVHIMTPSFSLRSKTWTWSACSRKYITSFLESSESTCLLDKPFNIDYKALSKLPGEIYSTADQCKLIYGENSTVCHTRVECDRIWCIDSNNLSKPCYTNNMPWADGTKCGSKMWCRRGTCLKKIEYEPVHGEWGEWSEYGGCSRTCGGGIKFTTRECDNPKPAYNGNYCFGIRKKYESCNTDSCPLNSKPFRAVQCSAFDGKDLNIPNIPKDVQWFPKYVLEEECKLYCEYKGSSNFYELASKVIDGTKCMNETNSVCVDGKCEVSGCDNVLNSQAKVDKCGICNGDNSLCKTFYGYKNISSYGYNFVVLVPKGASNLKVVQVSEKQNMSDRHFLVLLNQQKYYINGDWRLSSGKGCFTVAGNTVCYSGFKSPNETITVTGTLKSDMEIKVLSDDKNRNCNIYYTYNYHDHEEKKFKWSLKEFWTECYPICKGYQSREYECLQTNDLQVVADSKCKGERPQGKIRTCNDNCYLQWSVILGECTPLSVCGLGYQEQNVFCEKVFYGNEQKKEIVHHKDCHKAKVSNMPSNQKSCYKPCTEGWLYSPWSECNTPCGGLQWRSIQCVELSSNVSLPAIKCNHTLAEPLIQPCNLKPCSSGVDELESKENQVKWYTSSWNECSKSCGAGTQIRSVNCITLNGVVDDIECKFLNKPNEMRSCNNFDCPFWRFGPWSKCSKTCGEGIQTRTVLCSFNETVVKNELCNQEIHVEEFQICNILECSQSVLDINILNQSMEWIISEWSQCSVSCGEGVTIRNITCSSDYCNKTATPAITSPCYLDPCPVWSLSQWMPCYYPENCGLGYQVRQVQCQRENGEILNMTACDQSNKPEFNRNCETIRCEDSLWVTAPWNTCNVLCGNGSQYRDVSCQDLNGNLLDEKHCLKLSNKPDDKQPCTQLICPVWYSYEWGACDSSCVHQRVVECRQNNQVIDANLCNLDDKPTEEIECDTENCIKEHHVYKWILGDWTACSKSCGYSFKTRKVVCVNENSNEVNLLYCSHTERPKSSEHCFERPCPPSLQIGPWQECSVTCGGGFQLRNIYCQGEAGSILPDSECKLDQNITVRRVCNIAKCNSSFRWVAGPWSECSLLCGVGETYRKVQCINSDNITEPTYKCNEDLMPPNFKVCNIQDCPLRTCRDIQKKFSVYSDGEHTLLIKNKTLSIYCEGMHRNNPKEYITLIADKKQNYAEIYNKRLQPGFLCPENGRRQISCPNCFDYAASGVSFFKKLRLDIRNMVIILGDKTFADQFGQNPPGYATAGDCYSKVNCTQGSFMINLQKTGFRIADDVEWVSQGHHTSQQIQRHKDNQFVVGKCGGYCGLCTPNYKMGLKVGLAVS
ncbi:A disintegrin and metalloproteinase with thrombospondin motifs 9 isoform X1 [Hydra vulgaris]|uniref:A disintegrin and metalloproteinase with thrombospondin motifs 9 isoform X1 n=1 Tax=Hydra vulgaris TaxID=6087 RepID=UPI001F5E72FE|nr:A disintegrin and metalloproteinase with thrombospondin motifs 9-like isoform X1 [Hydra vulgaris]XP_047146093.1 A disintegrin and metalloproteinase with thrombospondin motifs 9-like isoform X1 [Hydra vulgaris]